MEDKAFVSTKKPKETIVETLHSVPPVVFITRPSRKINNLNKDPIQFLKYHSLDQGERFVITF